MTVSDLTLAYAVLSGLAMMAYWLDKRAAQKGTGRIPEVTLLILGLAGGWPGALIGQRIFRHKTRKTSFQAAFWLTVILNIVGIVWLSNRWF